MIFSWLRLQRSSNVDLVFSRNIFIDEMFVDWCLVKGEVKQDNVQDCVGDPRQGVRVTWSKWVGEADYVTLLFKNIAYVIGSLKCFVFVYLWILLDCWTLEYWLYLILLNPFLFKNIYETEFCQILQYMSANDIDDDDKGANDDALRKVAPESNPGTIWSPFNHLIKGSSQWVWLWWLSSWSPWSWWTMPCWLL